MTHSVGIFPKSDDFEIRQLIQAAELTIGAVTVYSEHLASSDFGEVLWRAMDSYNRYFNLYASTATRY